MTETEQRTVDSAGQFKPGHMVKCTVTNSEPGGYSVRLHKSNAQGFIPAGTELDIGEELSARFLCLHKGIAILSIGSWVEHIRTDPATQADWISSRLHKLHLKRASDLVPPPFSKTDETKFSMHERDLGALMDMLDTTHKTAVVKASSQEWCSRSVMLLFHGRVVGCIYTCKGLPQTQPAAQALQLMIADLQLVSTSLSLYTFPDNIMFPLSALFMGYRVQRQEEAPDAQQYMEYILQWLGRRSMTACLPIALPSSGTTCLVFVDQGAFIGAHHVEPQIFTKEMSYVNALLSLDTFADVEATVVPEQPDTSQYGVSLRKAVETFQSDR
jgi:hypothetical protein